MSDQTPQFTYSDKAFQQLVLFSYNCMSNTGYDLTNVDTTKIFQTNDIVETVKCVTEGKVVLQNTSHKGVNILLRNPDEIHIYVETINRSPYNVVEILCHEIIHSYDTYRFAEKYTNGKLSDTGNHILSDAFDNFSEFHAYSYANYYAPYFAQLAQGISLDTNQLQPVVDFLESYFEQMSDQKVADWLVYNIFQSLGLLYVVDLYYKSIGRNYNVENCLHNIFDVAGIGDIVLQIYYICIRLRYTDDMNDDLQQLASLCNQLDLQK